MQRYLLTMVILVTIVGAIEAIQTPPARAARPLWQQLTPRKKVASAADGDYTLTRENGPWLVLAASFSGPAGETEARDLVLELRRDFNLASYYYGMTFDLNEGNPGRGIDQYGGRIRRRYQRGARVVQHAVLVGEFPSLDDPEAQELLNRVKRLKPATLASSDAKPTSQSLATVREFHNYLKQKVGAPTDKGPMGHAFLSPNPMLPREFFVPQGIDKDVAKWNSGIDFTLMKCPGNYSIRVATFKGRTSLKAANRPQKKSRRNKNSGKISNALVVAAESAHKLTVALREKGWEAYEFHDRHESYVTVGSFDQGVQRPGGQIVVSHRDAQIIIDTFGAMKPNNIFNRPAAQDQRLEQQQKQRFAGLLSGTNGQVANGFYPKRFVGLPFDIYPAAVRVPRRSIGAAYARN